MEINLHDDDDSSSSSVPFSNAEDVTAAKVAEAERQAERDQEMADIQSHLHGGDEHEVDNFNAIIQGDQNRTSDVTAENSKANGQDEDEFDDEEDDEEDEEDDNVQITIGDLGKPGTFGTGGYGPGMSNLNLNLQKGGRQFGQSAVSLSATKNKSSLDLDQTGTFNGVPIYDLNLDSLEDKPWRKPGADITDYFNYGFNEDTWKVYCERQRRIRQMNSTNQFDTNAALNLVQPNHQLKLNESMLMKPQDTLIPSGVANENSKYNPMLQLAPQLMLGLPPAGKKPTPALSIRKPSGTIDVIGAPGPMPTLMPPPPGLLGNRPMDSRDRDSNSSGSEPSKENYNISVIGNRAGPPGPLQDHSRTTAGFPPTMPPPFFTDYRPPVQLFPGPIGPNGQPMPQLAPDFPPQMQARPTLLPNPPERNFDQDDRRPRQASPRGDRDMRDSYRERSGSSRDHHRPTYHDRPYEERPERRRDRDFRTERDYERDYERDRREQRSRERSRDRDDKYDRRHRSERSERKDKERDKEKESSSSKSKGTSSHSSSSKHESSSDHKHRSSSSKSSSKSSSSKRDSGRSKDSKSKDD